MENKKEIVPNIIIENKIFLIRGCKVILDSDIAFLYQIETKVLSQAVKRNIKRFPLDFAFQITKGEYTNLRSQFVTSSLGYGGRRYLPYVFTEHGVAMLSSVLRSQRAVEMNIFIVRAFIKMRELLATYKDLAQKIDEIERQQKEHGNQLASLYSLVRQLVKEPSKPKEIPKDAIGFAKI